MGMPGTRSTPAHDRAGAFLNRLVERTRREGGGGVLPALAVLAREAGVCYVTMWKAVAALKAKGVLHTAPRHRVSLAAAPAQTQTPPGPAAKPPVGPKWRRAAAGIEESIRSGVYGRGQDLPDRKALMRQWGVGYATLRKALAALVEAGAITPSGKGFQPPLLQGSAAGSRVTLMAVEQEPGRINVVAPLLQDRFRALERVCARNNLALQVAPVSATGGHVRLAADDDAPLGYVVWTAAIPAPVMDRLLLRIAGQGRPVAVMVDTEDFRLPFAQAAHGHVRVFSEGASSIPGRVVGRHLLDLGHRNTVWISPFHGSPWSQRRLDGILSAYSSAGVQYRVEECTDETVTMRELGIAVNRARDATNRSPVWAQVRRAIGAAADTVHKGHGPGEPAGDALVSAVKRRSLALVAESLVFTLTEPLLERAMRSRDTTAWVAANDEVAVACLEYLTRRSVRVPEDISLISFDDSPQAFERGIASYNFDTSALQNRMLSHILDAARPGRSSEPSGAGPVEVEGFVSHRGSVRQRAGKG